MSNGKKGRNGLGFTVRSTIGAGPGAPLDSESEEPDESEGDPYGPDSDWARSLRRKIDKIGARIRRMEFGLDGLDFEAEATMGAGVHAGRDPSEGGGLGFEVASTMGA